MASDRFTTKEPLETVVARIFKGIKSTPSIFQDRTTLILRTPDNTLTRNPLEARFAKITFYIVKELESCNNGRSVGIVLIRPSESNDGTEICIPFKSSEKYLNTIMEAFSSFVTDRNDRTFDTEIVNSINGEAKILEVEKQEVGQSSTDHPDTKNSNHTKFLVKGATYAFLGIIMLAVLIALGTCVAGGESSHRDYSTEETAEFLTNIDTPGTSEYKWYHDEYLPDNDLPQR